MFITSELAYGEIGRRGQVSIPPHSVLQYDIELIEIKPPGDAAAAVRVPGSPGAPQVITLPAKPK